MYGDKSGFKFGKQILMVDSKVGFEALVSVLLEKNVINSEDWKSKLLETDGVQIQKAPLTKKFKIIEVNENDIEGEEEN